MRPLKKKVIEMMQLREYTAKKAFDNGVLNEGLTPVDNDGGGNCVFMSLALIVFGDSA